VGGSGLDGEEEGAADGLDAAVVDVVAAPHAQHLAVAGVDGQRAARGDALAAADGDAVQRREEGAGGGGAGRRADGLAGAEALEVEGVDVLPDLRAAARREGARERGGRRDGGRAWRARCGGRWSTPPMLCARSKPLFPQSSGVPVSLCLAQVQDLSTSINRLRNRTSRIKCLRHCLPMPHDLNTHMFRFNASGKDE
jgi:hypothetical protein